MHRGRSCSAASGSPCSIDERMRVTSFIFMRRSWPPRLIGRNRSSGLDVSAAIVTRHPEPAMVARQPLRILTAVIAGDGATARNLERGSRSGAEEFLVRRGEEITFTRLPVCTGDQRNLRQHCQCQLLLRDLRGNPRRGTLAASWTLSISQNALRVDRAEGLTNPQPVINGMKRSESEHRAKKRMREGKKAGTGGDRMRDPGKSGINGHEMMTLEHQDLAERIMGAATLVHRRLGPGCQDHTRSQASDRLWTSTTFLVSCLPHCVVPLHNSASHGPARDESRGSRV